MAHPFMPMKARKLRKLTREREESNQAGPDSNRRPEFETTVADSRRNKTSPRPSNNLPRSPLKKFSVNCDRICHAALL